MADCIKKCVAVFTDQVGVPVAEGDIEIAHRSGKPGGSRPRPILARFFCRKKISLVLAARRKLKWSGVSIGEDLTRINYKVLTKANEHSATLATWSSNGKILAKLKNGKVVKIDMYTDLDETFRKEM